MKWRVNFLIILLLFPLVLKAQFISEIMYDLEGSDSGREWVEIYNNSDDFDITTWKFFEGSTNHSINLIEGSETISSGGIAIIADNTDKFLNDNPSFSGNLFDSSFSLSNTGETLILKDADLNEIFSVSYLSEWGAGGDGNSLHLIDNSWEPNTPNPGFYEFSTEPEEEITETEEVENNSSGSSFPVIPQIKMKGSAEEVVIVGAHSLFEAQVFGLEDELIPNARVVWNFGDGKVKEGGKILYSFNYPGDYVVFAHGSSGDFATSEKFIVKVIPSEVLIYGLDKSGDFIKIKNDSNEEIDLSWWMLDSADKSFIIPENTHILPQTEIILSQSTTGIDSRERPLNLLYPNGEIAHSYQDFNNPGLSIETIPNRKPVSFSNIEINEGIEIEEKIISGDEQVASTDFVESDENNQTVWYVLFVLLILASVSMTIFARKRIDSPKFKEEETVEDIEIIE